MPDVATRTVMRILGYSLFLVGLIWLLLAHLAAALPKAGHLTARLAKLPVQDSYSREQVRDVIWEISALRWSFPEQATYTPQQVTNILRTASMNSKQTRDGTAPSLLAPVLLLVVGAYVSGIGDGKRRNARPSTQNEKGR